MSVKKTDALYYPALFFVFAAFLFLVFYRLTFVIAAFDEIWITTETLPFVSLSQYHHLTIPFFGIEQIRIPSMTCFYTGTLPNFILVPFLYFLEPSYLSIRIGFIILAVLGLLSFNYCLRRWLGKWTALFVTLLTITDTMYLRAVRRGSEHEELLIINLLWIGLAFFTLRLHTQKSRYLAGAGLIWGIALWTKLHMLAYIAGIGLTCLIFNKQLKIKKIFASLKDFTVFALSFIAGCLPIINSNFHQHNILYELCGTFARHFDKTEHIPCFYVEDKLEIRLNQFRDFIQEASITEWSHLQNIGFPSLTILLIVFFVFYFFLPFNIFAARSRKHFAAGIIITYTLVFISLLFAPNNTNSSHLLAMLLMFELIAGLFIRVIANTRQRTRTVLILLFLTALTHTSLNRYKLMKTYYRDLLQNQEYADLSKSVLDEAQTVSKPNPLYFSRYAYANVLASQWYKKGLKPRTNTKYSAEEVLTDMFYILADTEKDHLPGEVIFRKEHKPISIHNGYILIKDQDSRELTRQCGSYTVVLNE